jgi:hypothetical protein
MAAALVSVTTTVAWADGGGGTSGGWGNVNCDQNPYPGCQLAAGHAGATPVSATSGDGGGSDGSGPAQFSCLNVMPYVPPLGPLPPPDGQSASSGAWYVSVCSGFHFGMPGGGIFYPPVWVRGGANRPLPAAEVARRAENNLALPAPAIRLSPAGEQLVNLPTWLAIDPAGWGERSARAAVPGVSVTATATPESVAWSTGDGSTTTCRDPGTIFEASDDPASASPTCGHTYRVSSTDQPGSAYAVTATVHWSVSWAGAGQAGTFADLTTAATTRVPVAEAPALSTH